MPAEIWGLLFQQAPLVILLGLILIGGARKVWVFGWQYDDLVRERDRAIEACGRTTEVNEAALRLLDDLRQAQKLGK